MIQSGNSEINLIRKNIFAPAVIQLILLFASVQFVTFGVAKQDHWSG